MAIKESYYAKPSYGWSHSPTQQQLQAQMVANMAAVHSQFNSPGALHPLTGTSYTGPGKQQTNPSFNAQSTQPGNQANNAVQKDPKK